MSRVLARARVGGLSPERFSFTLTKENADWLDLTTISALVLLVQKPSGALQTWTCTVISTTEDEAVCAHLFVANDLDEDGDYRLTPKATVTAADAGIGPVQWNPITLKVYGLYE
jgi:hypothetical protein